MAYLPLQCLPAFRAAAELQNLRAAATVLHLTPSAVSQQIAVLERHLGFAVFDRPGRKVVLNGAGRALLDSVLAALHELESGVQAASVLATGSLAEILRITVIPSLAQRWLLPRIGRWRARHPGIRLEIDATQQRLDLPREGLHVGIRTGGGVWPGLEADALFDLAMPLIVVGSAQAARRLAGTGATAAAIAREPLLGDPLLWQRWLAAAGIAGSFPPAATFSDAGLMLQAAEQDLGLTLARGLYIVDALRDGRLVRLSDVALLYEPAQRYFLVYSPSLRDWAPLASLRSWLKEELQGSIEALAGWDHDWPTTDVLKD
jgi:LysR family glycine cleavage system transcriptional activator